MEAEDQPQEEKPSGLDRKILIARDGVELGSFTYWDALPMKDSGELRPNDYVYRKSGKGGKWVHLYHVLRQDFFADHDWSEYDVLLKEELDKAKERFNGYKEMLKTSDDGNAKKEAEYRIQEYTELLEYLKGMKQREIKRRKETEKENEENDAKEKEQLDEKVEALESFISSAKEEDDFLEFFDEFSIEYMMFTNEQVFEIKEKIWEALRRSEITEEEKREICKRIIDEEEKADFWTQCDAGKTMLTDFLMQSGLLLLTADEIAKSDAEKEAFRKSFEAQKYTCVKCGRVTGTPESFRSTCINQTPHQWDKPTSAERI